MALIRHRVEGNFLVVQDTIENADPSVMLHFGPLSASLEAMFDLGWKITCDGKIRSIHSECKYRFYLELNGRRYRLGSISRRELDGARSFQPFIRRNCVCATTPDITLSLSPLDLLMRQYPARKIVPMIGNMTIKEFVRQHIAADL